MTIESVLERLTETIAAATSLRQSWSELAQRLSVDIALAQV